MEWYAGHSERKSKTLTCQAKGDQEQQCRAVLGLESSIHQCYEHFETVLNTCSNFEERVIHSAKQHPVRKELAQPLVEDEIIDALGKLKENKAGGKTGIMPEMLKYCRAAMMEYILDLFRTVWSEEKVPDK